MSDSQQDTEAFKRWTARRKTALVVQLLRGETTPAEAARTYDTTLSEIERWRDSFLAAGENQVRTNPRDELALEDAKKAIEAWVRFYNEQRPHQALGYLSPVEFRHINTPQLTLQVA